MIAYLSASPGLTLDELLRLTEGRVSPDDIFSMIAANIIPVDLHAAPLAEPWRVESWLRQKRFQDNSQSGLETRIHPYLLIFSAGVRSIGMVICGMW